MTAPGASGGIADFERQTPRPAVLEFPAPRVARALGRAERWGVTIAAGASVILIVYAALQIAGAAGVAAAPRGATPLFWRLKIGALVCAVTGPGLWRLGRATHRQKARALFVLIGVGIGAITLCAAVLP